MILLDRNADTFPVGLAGTPFEEVYRALRIVAATVWDVDPLVYRAGMAWGWYALHDPAALTGFRDVVVAALISAIAPMVKDTQTDAELVEYLRQWRSYTPTFPKLQAIYALFGAVVDIQPISDPESQSVLPVDDTRLAFYIRIESVDFSRPLTLAEAREIAVRATPLGSRPYPYYALETRIPCTVSPAPVGIYIRLENWETARPPAPPQQLGELVFVDASGAVVYSVESLNEMAFAPTGYFTIDDSDDVLFVEESPYPARGSLAKNYSPNVTIADGSGIDTELPYYSQKLYIPIVVWHDENWNLGADYFGWGLSDSSGSVYATNNTGSSRIVISIILAMIDATDAEIVEVKNQSDAHFNAFKWTSNGVSYWYVVDGDEDWTDDLQADGYEEVPPVVLPTVTFSDDISSGTVSLLTLPNAHSGYYTDAKFDSLRYYVKGTVSDPEYIYGLYGISVGWYGGKITWFDSSIGDLSDKLFTTGTPSVSTTPVKQTILRIFLITNNGISGYPVQDTIYDSVVGQISNYTYNNGQHSITLWFSSIGGDWTTFAGTGRLMLRYLDETTAFNNLDSFDLFNVSSGALSKATTTDRYDMYNTWNGSVTLNARYASCSDQGVTTVTVYDSSLVAYNAFKFTAGGTDYYYVLDGVQADWTDDLSSIGYNIHIDIWFALKASQSNATFGANDYWGSFVIDNTDKSLLQNFGVTLTQVTVDGVTYDVVSFDNPSFSFAPIGLYAGIRTDPRTGVNINNFSCERGPDGNAVYHPQICIWSTDAYNVTCKTWLCRITKNS